MSKKDDNLKILLRKARKLKNKDLLDLSRLQTYEKIAKQPLQLKTDSKLKPMPRSYGMIIEEQAERKGIEMRSGNFNPQQTFQMQAGGFPQQGIRVESPPPQVIRSGGDEAEIIRISPMDLETIYVREGMCHQWINRLVEYFLAADPEVKCGNTREQQKWDDFQSTFDWRELIKLNFQHKFTYGNAVWRWVYGAGGKKKISLSWIDPKYFDAKRNAMGKVQYDQYGKPVGYLQYLKIGQDITKFPQDRLIVQVPKFSYQSGRGIFFNPDEIIHFLLNRVGDFWWGIGILEPIYNFIKIKQNADEGYGEMMQRAALPRVVGYVGDEAHPPTQEAIDDVWEKLSDLESKHQFAGPYYYRLEILEPKRPERLQLALRYLIDGVVAGLGGPKPFITGGGEQTNRATLGDQKLWLERSLKMEQQDMSNQTKRYVLTPIAKQYGFKTIPELVWTETSTESLESKVDRLSKLAKFNLITVDSDLEKYIRKLEGLPPLRKGGKNKKDKVASKDRINQGSKKKKKPATQ